MTKTEALVVAQHYADGLSLKFPGDEFTVDTKGHKFLRIVQTHKVGSGGSVHAFVEVATGGVYKSAGWAAPAKGMRYETVDAALEAADRFGGYLYQR